MSKDEPLLSNCPLETVEPSRNYARVRIPGYKKKRQEKDKKKTRKENKNERRRNQYARAYVATRLLFAGITCTR